MNMIDISAISNMAFSEISLPCLLPMMLLVSSAVCLAFPGFHFSWGGPHTPVGGGYYGLFPEFYDFSCPQANDIVMSVLEAAISNDPRMAASLLRLHFHDCFVQGCDASVLLDDTATIASEKRALPNANSLRGFEVIDQIKATLEQVCPQTVSCADILALAARGSIALSGGPSWELPLGRRDSRTANINAANTTIPAPTFTVQQLTKSFQQRGLDQSDLVALSGGHTIGMARCTSFKTRLYGQTGNNNQRPDLTLERTYYNDLKGVCPPAGGDNNVSPLDYSSPAGFDNSYFKLILGGRGLLSSDEALLTGNDANVANLVRAFAADEGLFFDRFARSMVKMSGISPLLGLSGEVRTNCRRVNS